MLLSGDKSTLNWRAFTGDLLLRCIDPISDPSMTVPYICALTGMHASSASMRDRFDAIWHLQTPHDFLAIPNRRDRPGKLALGRLQLPLPNSAY